MNMLVKELIAALQKLDQDKEVMILDGFNGGGFPREINLSPQKHRIAADDIKSCGDCEYFEVGKTVIAMGYGCY
jgi:hypothetical protein